MSDEEREFVDGVTDYSERFRPPTIYSVFVGLAVGVLMGACGGWMFGVVIGVVIGLLIAGLSFLAYMHRLMESKRMAHCRNFPSDIAASWIEHGMVQSIQVKSDSIVELIENEDEGACYVFDVSDGQLFLLQGQLFYSDEDFPNSDMELVYGLRPWGFMTRYCRGQRLKPVQRLRRVWTLPYDDFHVFNGSVDTIEADLDKEFEH